VGLYLFTYPIQLIFMSIFSKITNKKVKALTKKWKVYLVWNSLINFIESNGIMITISALLNVYF